MRKICRLMGLAIAAASTEGCVTAAVPAGDAQAETRLHRVGQIEVRRDADIVPSPGGYIADPFDTRPWSLEGNARQLTADLAALVHWSSGAPQAAGSSRGVVQLGRQDRFRLLPTSRVCVETTIDPVVIPRIEAGGELVTGQGLALQMSERISERFHSLGLSPYLGTPERLRVNPYISDVADRSCLEQQDNVLVRLRVRSDATGRGYRITIEASQGRRRYSSAIERASIITISDEAREMIAPGADTLPGTGAPFWDVRHDFYRLSTLLIGHIWVRLDRGATMSGRYEITQDQLCVNPSPGATGHSQWRGQIEGDPGVRLSGDEIRALLVGRTLSHDVERATRLRMSGMITPYQEGFRADGTVWVRLDRGATMSGRYEIFRDQLCLALNNGTRECRHFFRAPDGGLIQRDSRGAPESTTPIIVE